jgi:hypothetical protein
MLPDSWSDQLRQAHRIEEGVVPRQRHQVGRPRKVDDDEHIATAKRMKADGHTGEDVAKYSG